MQTRRRSMPLLVTVCLAAVAVAVRSSAFRGALEFIEGLVRHAADWTRHLRLVPDRHLAAVGSKRLLASLQDRKDFQGKLTVRNRRASFLNTPKKIADRQR